MLRNWLPYCVAVVGALLVLAAIILQTPPLAQAIQILSVIILVLVTWQYAQSAKRQAEASVRMAEEAAEQRLVASRPMIIQKAVHQPLRGRTGYFSHFVVMNAGNGPAIELEVSLLDKEKNPLHSIRETFLRPGEQRNFEDFSSDFTEREESTYYLVCEYKPAFSGASGNTWYQSWLPFKLVKSSQRSRVYVAPGELEFHEVAEKERIDAFGSRNKPK